MLIGQLLKHEKANKYLKEVLVLHERHYDVELKQVWHGDWHGKHACSTPAKPDGQVFRQFLSYKKGKLLSLKQSVQVVAVPVHF